MSSTSSLVDRTPRRERERQRKSQELLEIAGEIFAARGFHGASMEDIAKAADYATGALYRYFESKEVLYIAVLEKKMEELLAYLRERAGLATDPIEALRISVRAQLEFASRNRAFIQIYFRERMEVSRAGEHWQRIDAMLRELIDWRAKGIAVGQKRGIFRKGQPELYALALEGMINGLVRGCLTREGGPDFVDKADFVIGLALHGILSEQ